MSGLLSDARGGQRHLFLGLGLCPQGSHSQWRPWQGATNVWALPRPLQLAISFAHWACRISRKFKPHCVSLTESCVFVAGHFPFISLHAERFVFFDCRRSCGLLPLNVAYAATLFFVICFDPRNAQVVSHIGLAKSGANQSFLMELLYYGREHPMNAS